MSTVEAKYKEGDVVKDCTNNGDECKVIGVKVTGTPEKPVVEYTVEYADGDVNELTEDEVEPP